MEAALEMRFLVLFAFLPCLAHAEDAWLARDAELLRWPDAKQISASFDEGTKVEVVVRDEALVRVRVGADFGWLPPDALLSEDPASVGEPDEPLAGQSPDGDSAEAAPGDAAEEQQPTSQVDPVEPAAEPVVD